MNKKLTLLLIVLCAAIAPYSASAQRMNADSTWTLTGSFSLSANQACFSNWASGGENSFGANAQLNYSADYKANKHIFNNRIELAYGMNNTESVGNRKSNDKIYFSSTYGYQIAKNLYASSLLTFQSQFADGFTYDSDGNRTFISTFMAPGYLTLGGGLTWTPKPWFTATFTPATWREVYVLNDDLSALGSYGVEAGHHSYSECGANLVLVVKHEIMKNVNLYSRLTLFSDYLENPENVDVDLEVQLNFTINKWLSTFISANMVYDDNISIAKDNGTAGPCLQFKENLGIGLQVAF